MTRRPVPHRRQAQPRPTAGGPDAGDVEPKRPDPPWPTGARPGARLYDHVARDLGQRIIAGDYAPGALLPNESECCINFRVGRTAVREAVKMLAAKGLIVSRPKVGSRVQPREAWNLLDLDVLEWYRGTVPFREFAADVQELRTMIEPEAAALAAANRAAEPFAALTAAYAGMSQASDEDAWNRADVAFHRAILEASGNALLMPFGRVIEGMLSNLFAYTFREGDPKGSLPGHDAVLTAITRGQPDKARGAARALLAETDGVLKRMYAAGRTDASAAARGDVKP
jgi:DNA-binding FadR family transcriptional regulator